ncbi:hypothetical protein MCOR02_008740 [Pyricularia oryzae]|nr:hypothetical protein MCOR02_008740 [Pyricularia oryzae]KAI6475348.1 hypothetical protein MCOR17_001589 [Pyricularia oryzae]KAI6510054.1 hypothetical protein MCOR13_001374 [Pyricularia oryzae]KAI6588633.1 hypothetical protein MCOR04_004114 [Pyricularia oryzae]
MNPRPSMATEDIATTAETSLPPRRRPLRTYGKRKAVIERDSDKPQPKRIRVPEAIQATEPRGHPPRIELPFEESCIYVRTSPTPSPSPSPSPSASPAKNAPKSSILRYFKKTAATPAPLPSPTRSQTADHSETPSSPVISPPPKRSLRAPRRLTTRPSRIIDARDDSPSDSIHDTNRSTETLDADQSSPGNVRTTIKEDSANPRRTKPCDCQFKPCSHQNKPGSRRAVKSPTSTIQMTLSLSARSSSITQCRECDMLYNPLHPSDVKNHSRHHAALAKIKAQG